MKKLENILKNIGLSDSECSILSTLIIRGDSTAHYLSKHTALPRQTVYSILERLETSGLIASSDRSGIKRFSATVDMLEAYLKEKASTLNSSQKELANIAVEIEHGLQEHLIGLPHAKYFTGELGLKYLFESILKDFEKPRSQKVFKGFGVNSYQETGIQKTLASFFKRRAKLGVKTKLIVADAEDDFGIGAGDDPLKRHVKKIAIKESQAGCYIIDDTVYFFSFKDRAGIKIEHKPIAELLSNIFDYTWGQK